MTYHNYTSLYLFFIFIFHLFLEIVSFTPVGRNGHSSVLVGSKLYFFGGSLRGGSSNEVFYLDVSEQFKVATPPWNDLTANQGIPVKSFFGSVSLSEANNEQSIYLIGGITRDIVTSDDSFTSLTYKLDLKSGRWEIPIAQGKVPAERRRNINSVNDKSGNIYIFGGATDSAIGSPTVNFFNDMIIFNSVELSWSATLQSNAPTARISYSATLLSNGVIVYIGGSGPTSNGNQLVDITQINLYNTKSSTWSVQTAKIIGQVESRQSHTAILAPNGDIIVNGGSDLNDFQVNPNTAVLNTEKFEWTVPNVSSNVGIVPTLKTHTANLVGNHMIVAFGNVTQPNGPLLPIKNTKIYIMDIRSYTWIDTFEPTSSTSSTNATNNTSIPISSTTSSNPTNSSVNKPDIDTTINIITGTVCGFVGSAVLIIIGFFGYKRYQRKKQNENLIIPW